MGAYIWRGDLTDGFWVTSLGDLYMEGLIFGILRYLVVRVQRTAKKWTEKSDARVKLLVLSRSVLFYTVESLSSSK